MAFGDAAPMVGTVSDMWFLFQGLIIFAVGASNIYWHWTPNGYFVGLLGIGLAYGATWLIQSAQRWIKGDHGAKHLS